MEWGCDGDSPLSQLWIPCVSCGGEEPACKRCLGTGHEEVFRCPWAVVTEETRELMALFHDYPQVLPLAGGLYDQPARYVRAMRFLQQATAQLEGEIARAAEAERRPSNG